MNKYIENLQKAQEESRISKIEFTILRFLWQRFKIVLPQFIFLPLIYNFVIVFSILIIGVSSIVVLTLVVHSLFYSLDEIYNFYYLIKDRYWNVIMFGTVIWLLSLELSRSKSDWNAYTDICWRKIFKINMKTNQVFIFFSIFIFILAVAIFTVQFIVFLITALSLIVILESIKEVLLYKSVNHWVKVSLEDIEFDIIEESVISDVRIGKVDRIKLYSLRTRYTYIKKGKKYCSAQVYIDEPRDKKLFQNKNDYTILQWIEENKNIKNAYINPKNVSQAVLFPEVLLSSFFGKIFIMIGAILTILVTTNYIDWAYYFA